MLSRIYAFTAGTPPPRSPAILAIFRTRCARCWIGFISRCSRASRSAVTACFSIRSAAADANNDAVIEAANQQVLVITKRYADLIQPDLAYYQRLVR